MDIQMASQEIDRVNEIAKELAANRVARDKAWAEFTLISVIAILGIPTLCFRLGLPGTALSIVVAGLCCWTAWILSGDVMRQRELDRELFQFEDPRSMGLLFESLPYAGGTHKAAIRERLKGLLPRFRRGDTNFITWEQGAIMQKSLLYGGDDELSLSILRYYMNTGDGRERYIVRMLAEGILTRTRDNRIQQTARECLRVIVNDENLLRPTLTPEFNLLRPASATTFAADHLMRPAD
jgi:hypothetical protein